MFNQKRASFEGVLGFYKNAITNIRTGRATPAMIEDVVVDAYGQKMHIKELATITAPEPRSLTIQPWDKGVLEAISGAIRKSEIGLNPVVDGQLVRISVPSLSEERRQELIKLMKHKLENGRVMVRQSRHEAMSDIKKWHADKEISDDDLVRMEKEVQRAIDETMEMIDAMGKKKEDELLQI